MLRGCGGSWKSRQRDRRAQTSINKLMFVYLEGERAEAKKANGGGGQGSPTRSASV